MIAEIDGDGSRSLACTLSMLEEIRDLGFATDENEHTDGISAHGIAIRDENGQVYSLSTPVPSSRFSQVRDTLAAELTACRAALTA